MMEVKQPHGGEIWRFCRTDEEGAEILDGRNDKGTKERIMKKGSNEK